MQRSGSMRSTKSAWHIILFMKRKKKNGQSISTSALIAAALESTGPFRLFYRPTVKFRGNILATENQLAILYAVPPMLERQAVSARTKPW